MFYHVLLYSIKYFGELSIVYLIFHVHIIHIENKQGFNLYHDNMLLFGI